MDRLRAVGTGFRRVHLAALVADWRRTVLCIVGVAIGTTVVLGVLTLKSELTRPFDAFGPALTHAADAGVIEVTPKVSGRLPTAAIDRLQTQVPGAQAVIPVVAALTPLGTGTGFFVVGGSCQLELLVGPFDCARRTVEVTAAAGPGVPVQMATVVAARLGLRPGDEITFPGLPAGSAHLAATFDDFELVAGINDGNVVLIGSTDVAARLFGALDFVTAAFVVPRPGADIIADVDAVIGDVASASPPHPHVPAVFEAGTQSLDLIALAGIIVGCLIAVNTILLAIEDRRAVLGTIGAIGAKPATLAIGMIAEGALVGLVGGLLSVPTGYLLGRYLIDTFGRSMLAGSGGSASAHFSAGLFLTGAIAGVACGVLAMAGPAIRLARQGPLASMSTVGGVTRARRVPFWPFVVGTCLIVGATIILTVFERGSLPLPVGINSMTVALVGVVLVTVWFAPRGAAGLIRCVTTVRADVGRLLAADVRRYALLFALSAGLLAESASLAIGASSMQVLGAEQIAAQKADRLPNALLITGQAILDQRDGRLPDATFAAVIEAADGRPTSSLWRSTISSGIASRLIAGITAGDWFSQALFLPRDAGPEFWTRIGDGQVGLSRIAASRLDAATGDTVELPTVNGPRHFRVAGIVEPQLVNDSAVGDIVVTSDVVARAEWAAARDRVAVDFASPADAAAHRNDFLDLGTPLWVYDEAQWQREAISGITRFLQPFTLAAYIVMLAAGLSLLNVLVLGLVQRRRERAVLRAVGVTTRQEQSVIVASACVLGVLVAILAAVFGTGLTYLWSLGSPVYYGITIEWGAPLPPLVVTGGVVLALVLLAAVYPVVHARRFETADVLRTG